MMYTNINGTLKEVPTWLAGINGTMRNIDSFPVGINGTRYTIYLTSYADVTVRCVNNWGADQTATESVSSKVYINNKTISLYDTMRYGYTLTTTESVIKETQIQIDVRKSLQAQTPVYLNNALIYTGGSKSDDDPRLIVLTVKGDISISMYIGRVYVETSYVAGQQITIQGDAVVGALPSS